MVFGVVCGVWCVVLCFDLHNLKKKKRRSRDEKIAEQGVWQPVFNSLDPHVPAGSSRRPEPLVAVSSGGVAPSLRGAGLCRHPRSRRVRVNHANLFGCVRGFPGGGAPPAPLDRPALVRRSVASEATLALALVLAPVLALGLGLDGLGRAVAPRQYPRRSGGGGLNQIAGGSNTHHWIESDRV